MSDSGHFGDEGDYGYAPPDAPVLDRYFPASPERCAVCGEDIPVGEAEFDLEVGRIGLPYHKECLGADRTT